MLRVRVVGHDSFSCILKSPIAVNPMRAMAARSPILSKKTLLQLHIGTKVGPRDLWHWAIHEVGLYERASGDNHRA